MSEEIDQKNQKQEEQSTPTPTEAPKVIYVEKARKPFPWKTIGKYALVFLISGLCGFGGGLLANHVDRKQTAAINEQNGNSYQLIPGFGSDGSSEYSNGESGSSDHVENTNKAALGVSVKETSDGVYIAGFSQDSNAESAGLKINDKITAIDGNKYSTYNDIVSYIGTKNVGDSVKVTVERDGEEKTVTVKLIERSSQATLPGNSDSSIY